tara:strand:- start:1726 stop:2061 length:336 start_codon:yes stop_codon:yes gene_type:complete
MDIEKSQFKCMNTFTHNNRFRTSKQPLPDQNKIFQHKNIKNAGKPKEVKEKDIFDFKDDKHSSNDKHSSKFLQNEEKKSKPKAKAKVKPTKDIFDVNESIGNHNKIKLKNY